MSFQEGLILHTFEAGQDLSGKQFYFVKLASDGQIDPCGDGQNAIGVLQNDPDAAGKAATVAIFGKTKVLAGGSITRGANVASNADGKAVTSGSDDEVLGVALETAVSGDIISVLFQPRGIVLT